MLYCFTETTTRSNLKHNVTQCSAPAVIMISRTVISVTVLDGERSSGLVIEHCGLKSSLVRVRVHRTNNNVRVHRTRVRVRVHGGGRVRVHSRLSVHVPAEHEYSLNVAHGLNCSKHELRSNVLKDTFYRAALNATRSW